VTDIATWLGQQLDEDEAMARAAAAFYDDDDQDGVSWNGHAGRDLDGYTRFWIAPHLGVVNDVASGLHINRHDPDRVLREVAAKRTIIAETLNYMSRIDGEWGCCHNEESIAAGRCEDLLPENEPIFRALASVYADRPGYKEEWKPAEAAPAFDPKEYWATMRKHEQEAREARYAAGEERPVNMWKASEEGEKP
jgi:hypothetical protein